MNKKLRKSIGQVITYSPLAGIIYASFLNLSTLQHQILMLLLLVWVNSLFLIMTIGLILAKARGVAAVVYPETVEYNRE